MLQPVSRSGSCYTSGQQARPSIRGLEVQSPPLVDVPLSKTLDPELLPVAVSTAYECNMERVFEYLF